MVSVFVSHSKHDSHLRKYFSEIFTNIGLRAQFMEWEILDNKYAGYEIAKKIRAGLLSSYDTTAVFVLLGKNLEQPPSYTPQFTHNWVNFEVGAAAGSLKPVWVFEDFNETINFPIPYVTDYAQYNLDSIEHLRFYGDVFNDWIMTTRNYTKPARKARCPYPDCNAQYRCWANSDEINCPVCRRGITWKSPKLQNDNVPPTIY